MLKLAAEILKDSPNDVHELALFLAGRNTVERQRLKIYLTEEVCIYQGIEDPKAAWHLLRDYINMSEDMNVPYNLCPKSLKLRHDLAARNHRLVLEEIERKKFKEKAAAENYARLEWTSKDGKWAVLVPKDAGDLVREGSELSHCVGSYANMSSMAVCASASCERLKTWISRCSRSLSMRVIAARPTWASTTAMRWQKRFSLCASGRRPAG